MREFQKSHKLDHVCYDLRGPVLDEANRMAQNGVQILKLNIGNPAPFHFTAPDEIIQDMQFNLRDAEGYSDSKGIFSARKAIMQYCQLKNIEGVGINDIYTGNGVSEMITMSMQGLLDNGDEMLVPAPDYPLWTASVTLAGGNAVHYMCDEQNEWNPDIDDIRKKITDKTKGIVIINPNNPTGALYSKEILEEIVQIAREHELIIFSDEIYDRLVMDGLQHISIASLAPDVPCVTFNGLSKSHRVAGFRCGWMIISGDKKKIKGYIEGLNLLSSMRLCSNVPAQQIIQTALGGVQSVDKLLQPGGRIYEQRECTVCAGLPAAEKSFGRAGNGIPLSDARPHSHCVSAEYQKAFGGNRRSDGFSEKLQPSVNKNKKRSAEANAPADLFVRKKFLNEVISSRLHKT